VRKVITQSALRTNESINEGYTAFVIIYSVSECQILQPPTFPFQRDVSERYAPSLFSAEVGSGSYRSVASVAS
jgi:hypothetical protein